MADQPSTRGSHSLVADAHQLVSKRLRVSTSKLTCLSSTECSLLCTIQSGFLTARILAGDLAGRTRACG